MPVKKDVICATAPVIDISPFTVSGWWGWVRGPYFDVAGIDKIRFEKIRIDFCGVGTVLTLPRARRIQVVVVCGV
jgi:hypothetical protein